MNKRSITDESVLAKLISLWQSRRAEGSEVSLTELCQNRPDLLSELQQRLAVLERLDDLAGTPHSMATISHDGNAADSARELSTLDGDGLNCPTTPVLFCGWPEVPGYEIVSELGSGGMGVVYQARQRNLNRLVALKMVKAERFTREELNRFLAEAEAVAAIKHPHVVQVYEYGNAADRPFLVLEYLPGGTLAKRLKVEKRLAPKTAAALVAKLAKAVHAVHDRGIVHRDLKPGNVLFDEAGEPKVTDFGLAKRTTRSDLTDTQAVMGTPSYMAPEQARGKTKFVGPAADVYALGVILYECLTGVLPLVAEDTLVLLRKVAEEEPAPPCKRVAGIPRDLDLICLKCLAKEPAERYATAADFAADLQRFLDGEPVGVRASGLIERAAKWARRKPTLAAAYSLSLLVIGLLGITSGTSWLWRQAETARRESLHARDHLELEKQQTEQALVLAEEARRETLQAKDRLEQEQRQTEQALQRAEAARREATQAKDQLDTALQGERRAKEEERQAKEKERRAKERESAARAKLDQLLYVRRISLAYAEWRDNEIARMEQLLKECPPQFRQWEWNYLSGLFHVNLKTLRGHAEGVTAVAVSPDGRFLVSGSEDGTVRIWDASSAKTLSTRKEHTAQATSLAFSPDSRYVVSAGLDGKIVKWDVQSGEPVFTLPKAQPKKPSFPGRGQGDQDLFSPFLVAWQAPPSGSMPRFRGDSSSRNGNPKFPRGWEKYGSRPGSLIQRQGTRSGVDGVTSIAYSSNGKLLVSSSTYGMIRVWDARTGESLLSFKGDKSPILSGDKSSFHSVKSPILSGDKSPILSVSISPDCKHLAGATESKLVQVWDAETGKTIHSLAGHIDRVTCVVFSPDGKLLASSGDDSMIRLWDASKGKEIPTLLWHGGGVQPRNRSAVTNLSFSQDGKRLASGGVDRVVRVWNVLTGEQEREFRGHTEGVNGVAFWPDGSRLVSASSDKTLMIWEPQRQQETLSLAGHGAEANSVTFSPDSKHLASTSEDKTVILWDARTGRAERTLRGHGAAVNGVSFSPDGRCLATSSEDKTVRIWDVNSGEEKFVLKGHLKTVQGVTFSPDGTRLASASEDGTVKLWSAGTGVEERTLSGHQDYVYWVVFSPDGKRLASASKDRSIALWDARTGRQERVLQGHTRSVAGVAFSPDGQRLASAGLDYGVRVWDAATGERLLSLDGHKAAALAVAFSPDGQRLASAGADRTVKLWDAGTGEEVLSLRQHTKHINGVAFSPDGQCLATASADGTVAVWQSNRVPKRAEADPSE